MRDRVWTRTSCRSLAVQTVAVDIKPESLQVDSNGLINVLKLGASDFDASKINVSSVVFAGATASTFSWVDANQDGHLDLQLSFRR